MLLEKVDVYGKLYRQKLKKPDTTCAWPKEHKGRAKTFMSIRVLAGLKGLTTVKNIYHEGHRLSRICLWQLGAAIAVRLNTIMLFNILKFFYIGICFWFVFFYLRWNRFFVARSIYFGLIKCAHTWYGNSFK